MEEASKMLKPHNYKGQLQIKHNLLSHERALKMVKNDTCLTVISQAVLEIFHFKLDIPRKCPRISIESGEQ